RRTPRLVACATLFRSGYGIRGLPDGGLGLCFGELVAGNVQAVADLPELRLGLLLQVRKLHGDAVCLAVQVGVVLGGTGDDQRREIGRADVSTPVTRSS